MSMTKTQIKTSAATFVRTVKQRTELADTHADLAAIANDIADFLVSPGATLLTDAQIRNLERRQASLESRVNDW